MWQSIADRIDWPTWAPKGTRWRTLGTLDRILDGTFYDHLKHGYYDEKSGQTLIELKDRRPSAQYRLARQVARWTSRRLFASRHQPKIGHKDKGTGRQIKAKLDAIGFWPVMMQAAYLGSVGAVAITFRVDDQDRVSLKVWRARFCTPSINEFGDLEQLRLHIPVKGKALKAIDFKTDFRGSEIEDANDYWFVRDYGREDEKTYKPMKASDWNPEQGFTSDKKEFVVEDEETVPHGLGFVPAQWIKNLTGGEGPDGASTWIDAVPNMVDIDYTLSQSGRGIRYNCSPQLVIKGKLVNFDDILVRGPTSYIHLDAGVKDQDGFAYGDGDAKLLEMTGHGTEAALKQVDKLRELALESIAASRKNPEHMKGVLSGRAMEFLEEDSHDLVMELRTSFGDEGALPLIRKLVGLTMNNVDTASISLHWPRLFQPTPEDLGNLIPALVQTVTPIPTQLPAPKPVGQPGAPAPAPSGPTDKGVTILTLEEVQAYLRANMDLGMLDIGEEEDDQPAAEEPEDMPVVDGDPGAEMQHQASEPPGAAAEAAAAEAGVAAGANEGAPVVHT